MAAKKLIEESYKKFEEGSTEHRVVKVRRLLMVHSYIYYRLNNNLISDSEYDSLSKELVDLHKKCGFQLGFFDLLFEDWDGSTGYHLCGYASIYDNLCRRLIENYEKV